MDDQGDGGRSDILARALGQGLQLVRETRGWSRAEMVDRLPFNISRRTLNSYELGDSHFSVLRFVEMCALLRIHAADVLGVAMQRAGVEPRHVYVDIPQVRRADHDGIRRWAENRYSGDPGTEIVRLTPDTIREMAALCDISWLALVDYLTQFAPDVAALARRHGDDVV
jgi:hypothetical protein